MQICLLLPPKIIDVSSLMNQNGKELGIFSNPTKKAFHFKFYDPKVMNGRAELFDYILFPQTHFLPIIHKSHNYVSDDSSQVSKQFVVLIQFHYSFGGYLFDLSLVLTNIILDFSNIQQLLEDHQQKVLRNNLLPIVLCAQFDMGNFSKYKEVSSLQQDLGNLHSFDYTSGLLPESYILFQVYLIQKEFFNTRRILSQRIIEP